MASHVMGCVETMECRCNYVEQSGEHGLCFREKNHAGQRRWVRGSVPTSFSVVMGWLARRSQAAGSGSEAQIHQCLCLTHNTSF